jgi:hypothetical protein
MCNMISKIGNLLGMIKKEKKQQHSNLSFLDTLNKNDCPIWNTVYLQMTQGSRTIYCIEK